MRERARDKGRLEDIVEYSTNVTNLIEGYSLEALIADKRTYYSVMNQPLFGQSKTSWCRVQGNRTDIR